MKRALTIQRQWPFGLRERPLRHLFPARRLRSSRFCSPSVPVAPAEGGRRHRLSTQREFGRHDERREYRRPTLDRPRTGIDIENEYRSDEPLPDFQILAKVAERHRLRWVPVILTALFEKDADGTRRAVRPYRDDDFFGHIPPGRWGVTIRRKYEFGRTTQFGTCLIVNASVFDRSVVNRAPPLLNNDALLRFV
ncbi:MAG: hypothetical protein J0I06_22950 [Planctomycetes bacterium]|nr:hypothetical protein [Planctomycetota bacterium]